MSGTIRGGQLSFTIKIGAALLLVGLGDHLTYAEDFAGPVAGSFALGWAAMTIATNSVLRQDRRALATAVVALGFAAVLVEMPSLLASVLFGAAITTSVLLPRTAGFDDAWRWGKRVLLAWLTAPSGPLRDVRRWTRARRRSARSRLLLAPVLIVPIAGTVVFALLFGLANPIISDAFGQLQLPALTFTTLMRLLWWGLIFTLVWTTLRPRRGQLAVARAPLDPMTVLPGLSVPSVTLALALFNAVFAIENLLDLTFLWSGTALPQAVSYARYAHQGAYPLIATALLAGAFVLIALRPGSATAANRSIRRLVTAWVAQNLFLVASSMLRTCAYIDAYSLTPLRLAALVWMLLVAAGLVLIIWRLLTAKSATWLINANSLVAVIVLAAASVVDFGAVSASWNVAHSREAGGQGAALDLCFLHGLGGSALVPLTELAQRSPASAFGNRVRWVRAQVLEATLNEQQRDWSWRNARRLAAAGQVSGLALRAVTTPARQCDGTPYPPAPPPEPVAPRPLPVPFTQPPPLPLPLTPGPLR